MYEDLSPGFRADYGFVPRVDTRTATATVFRQFWGKPKGWFNLIRLGVMGESVWNHAGTLTDRGLTLGLAYQGNLESLVNLHANFLRTFYNGQYFDTAFGQAIGRIRPFSGAEVGVQAMAGQTIDYANSRLAQGLSVGPNLSLSIFRRLNLVASHAYERLFLHGDTIYIANLSQLKLVWNFSVRSFVRAILQYSDQEQNPAAYTFPVDSQEPRPLHPVPVLLQAQPADGPLPGLFGQLRWAASSTAGSDRTESASPGPTGPSS